MSDSYLFTWIRRAGIFVACSSFAAFLLGVAIGVWRHWPQ